MKRIIVLTASLVSLVCSGAVRAEEPRYSLKASNQTEVQATYEDIRKTLGIVPGFLRDYPQQSIPGAWQEMKAVQLSNTTALSPKTKELMGLAVASQIPCTYCTEFHTEAAKLNGASKDELQEAVALASCVRHWSTFFNGAQLDETSFRGDVDKMVQHVREQMATQQQPASNTPATIVTAADAMKDIEATFGFIPEFVKQFSEAALPGAWKDVKSLEMSNTTALAPKVKDLISLGVSAQVPCKFCVYFDTQFAKLDGASDQEIQEAIAMASLTRKWSTVLNGLRTDQTAFKKEVQVILAHAKAQGKQPAQVK